MGRAVHGGTGTAHGGVCRGAPRHGRKAARWRPTTRHEAYEAEGQEVGVMKLLLTSSGIRNPSIENALVDMLGKPIGESNALFIPTAIYPFPGGGRMAWGAITGSTGGPLA